MTCPRLQDRHKGPGPWHPAQCPVHRTTQPGGSSLPRNPKLLPMMTSAQTEAPGGTAVPQAAGEAGPHGGAPWSMRSLW